jgi:L-amino acid N-acyltransferase YncA
MDQNIHFACIADIPAILEIYNYYVCHTAISFETEVPDLTAFTERFNNIAACYPFLVYKENGEILGYAYGGKHRQRQAYKWSVDVTIYLDKDARGRGIGKLLYSNLFDLLKKQGFYTAYAGITLPNEQSVGIHEHFGFKKVAHYNKVGYKRDQWWDVGWWELELNTKRNEVPEDPLVVNEL